MTIALIARCPVRILGSLLGLLMLVSGCVSSTPKRKPDLDLKIVHARIVDGTGAPWYRADLGVIGDRIATIGDLSAVSAATTIDAGDRILAPGFIDLLGQSQNSVLIDPHLEGKVRQGVTTEITGEGHSPGPISEAAAKEISEAGKPSWRTLGEYMQVLEKGGSAINFAFFVGASNPRSLVIGEINRDPTVDEQRQMNGIVDQAMREGAIGLSTSLIYVPAVYSKTEEIISMARVAARYGGVYFTHVRNEADRIFPALDEAFRIGAEAEIPVNIWHLKIGGSENWGRMPQVIAYIQAQRDRGLDVAANVYPYIASSTGLTALAPDWALEGGYAEFLKRLQDPPTRQKIADQIRASGFYGRINGASGVLVTRIPNPQFALYEKKRLDEIAKMMDLDPVDAALRLYEAGKTSPNAIYFSMREDDVKYALAVPWVSVGADSGAVVGEMKKAGAHPRAYGTFPRVVGHYVRDEKLFSLEEAVRKMTSQAADRLNIRDRGLIRPGMKADLIIFDPATVRDVATYEDPHHYSVGISDVIVNGVPVLRDGTMTDRLPGRVLRGSGYQPAAH